MIWIFSAYAANILEWLVFTKFLHSANPLVFIFLFYFFGSFFMGFFAFWTGRRVLEKTWNKVKEHKYLIYLYVGGALFSNVMWFYSLYLVGIGVTAIVFVFSRAMIITYAYIFMDDRFSFDKIISIIVGFVALLFFALAGNNTELGLGIIIGLLSCVGSAMESISRKKLAYKDIHPEKIIFLRHFAHFAFFAFVIFFYWKSFGLLFEVDQILVMSALATAVLGACLVPLFLFWGMRIVKLSQYEAIIATKPVLLNILAILIFGEQMTVWQNFFGAIVICSSFYFFIPIRKAGLTKIEMEPE